MTHILTLLTFILGLATCILSLFVAGRFWLQERLLNKHSKQLTAALKWQLIGEAVIGTGTLIFAGAAYSGSLSEWSPEQSSTLRIVMFLATSITTLHLSRVIGRLRDAG